MEFTITPSELAIVGFLLSPLILSIYFNRLFYKCLRLLIAGWRPSGHLIHGSWKAPDEDILRDFDTAYERLKALERIERLNLPDINGKDKIGHEHEPGKWMKE